MGQSQSSVEWLRLLESVSVHEVLRERAVAAATGAAQRPAHLIQLKSTDKFSDALQLFQESRIQSAPVCDMGFFDLLDAVAFISRGAPRTGECTIAPTAMDEPILKMIKEIDGTKSLKQVFEVMNKTHLHRLAVLAADHERVIDVIAQSDVLAWICKHAGASHVTELASTSLKDLGFAHKKDLHVCSTTDGTLWAYGQIATHQISAMPVVDQNGQIVGALSGTQLRGMTAKDTSLLCLPVGAFLEARKHYALNYCIPTATFSAALHMMNAQGLHRLFIVDPDTLKPVGVLTLSDVIRLLSK